MDRTASRYTILVPVDFGAASEAALRYARMLAHKFNATIVVMHAYEVPFLASATLPDMPAHDVESAVAHASQRALDAMLANVVASWPNACAVLRRGEPSRTILDVAEELEAGVIVMGTHGRRGLAHALLGSVAERVVRASRAPVLTLRADPTTDRPASYDVAARASDRSAHHARVKAHAGKAS
jgi:nucleotide-binding universal stress UspA family protein